MFQRSFYRAYVQAEMHRSFGLISPALHELDHLCPLGRPAGLLWRKKCCFRTRFVQGSQNPPYRRPAHAQLVTNFADAPALSDEENYTAVSLSHRVISMRPHEPLNGLREFIRDLSPP